MRVDHNRECENKIRFNVDRIWKATEVLFAVKANSNVVKFIVGMLAIACCESN